MNKNVLGVVLCTAAALIGILGTFMIFMQWYEPAMHAEAAEPGCEILLKYIMPGLLDVALIAGALYAVAAYGFFTGASWAFPLSVTGNVLALQASWFINVPMMAASLPPVYLPIFIPNLLLYFLLLKLVGKVSWNRTLFGLFAGMTFVFTFMNGVASLSRIITVGMPIFTAVQRLHWISSIAWGVVTVSLILKPREWTRVLALVAALIEVVVGIPLAVVTSQELGRFSLFSPGPIFSLALLVVLIWPGLWTRLTADRQVKKTEKPHAAEVPV